MSPFIKCVGAVSALTSAPVVFAGACEPVNAFKQTNIISNLESFEPEFVDPLLVDAWGIVVEPAGVGGDLWVSNAGTGTSTSYVGDIGGEPLGPSHPFVVEVPKGAAFSNQADFVAVVTGQVDTGYTTTDFIVEGLSGPQSAKLVFATVDGVIAAWADGTEVAEKVVDLSFDGGAFTGIAVTDFAEGNRLYACDFGNATIRVYDSEFNEIKLSGDWIDPQVDAFDNYSAFNMLYHDGLIYVAWALIAEDNGTGDAEEDAFPGYGFVSAFDIDGNHVASFEHTLANNAPWGLAIAPDDFGPFSGDLLVGNFGDGRLYAYDRETLEWIDYVRDLEGNPVEIDGLWGLAFGNGEALGESDHLYFAAGPNMEEDGLFGKLQHIDLDPNADIDGSGVVESADLNMLLWEFGQSNAKSPADLDASGTVDAVDLNLLLQRFGQSCG